MILAHRVQLNGNQLDQADDRILVTGIRETAPRMTVNAQSWGFRDGQRVTELRRDYLEIQILFKIRLKKNHMNARDAVISAVMAWARDGGWLTCDQKTGKRLRVKLTGFPQIGDPWKWAEEYTLTFRASDVPYWEDIDAASITFSGSAGGVISAIGTARAVCNAEWLNQSGSTVNGITLTVGDTQMVFTGLGLVNGAALVIDHDDDGLLRIRKRAANGTYTSAMACRTAESDDDLAVDPGTDARCGYSPNYSGRCTISCRGRWL